MRDGDWLQSLWGSDGFGARIARAALTPAEMLFGIITSTRASLYSSGILPTRPTVIPALSIGNLTVGGTGKTPLTAYFARRLLGANASAPATIR